MPLDGRDERVGDLYFIDQTGEGDPAEDGLTRYVNSDLRICINGIVYSLISGGTPFDIDNCIFENDGGLVYANDELVVKRT